MASRDVRKRIAEETVAIADNGRYQLDGRTIDIGETQAAAIAGTTLYTPAAVAALPGVDDQQGATEQSAAAIAVRNCTTFAGARALLADDPSADVLCLNFASARNPGGGFLGGSQAQEEALCRGSGLYPCLITQPTYYEANRAAPSSLYTDHLIHSPSVPVFRDDEDRLVAEPITVSILTAPAPNAGAIRHNEPDAVEHIMSTMARRIRVVLAVAADRQHRQLVLGAWGCGVFGNDPTAVAGAFRDALHAAPFATSFARVVFAVLDFDPDESTIAPFRNAFGD